MIKQTTVYCKNCHKEVSYHCENIDHWKQLLITILTCGLWLPMWLMAISPTKICNTCNEPIWKD
ncbi:MAG: hypothetical protein WC071_10005 [Victivallaceae bacterium]